MRQEGGRCQEYAQVQGLPCVCGSFDRHLSNLFFYFRVAPFNALINCFSANPTDSAKDAMFLTYWSKSSSGRNMRNFKLTKARLKNFYNISALPLSVIHTCIKWFGRNPSAPQVMQQVHHHPLHECSRANFLCLCKTELLRFFGKGKDM